MPGSGLPHAGFRIESEIMTRPQHSLIQAHEKSDVIPSRTPDSRNIMPAFFKAWPITHHLERCPQYRLQMGDRAGLSVLAGLKRIQQWGLPQLAVRDLPRRIPQPRQHGHQGLLPVALHTHPNAYCRIHSASRKADGELTAAARLTGMFGASAHYG